MARIPPSGRLVAIAFLVLLVVLYAVGSSRPAAPAPTPAPTAVAAAEATPSPSPAPETAAATVLTSPVPSRLPATPTPRPPAACAPTDQDRYVYNPTRLDVLGPCIRVTGTVAAVRHEADGDLHILLALDPPYQGLLRPANQGEELGDLVVEPVCVRGVTQADAVDVCASDPDPLPGPFPVVGDHVWMEGRYVLDLQHGGWAELHPLYRWGR